MYRRGLIWHLREFYWWKIRYPWISEDWLIVLSIVLGVVGGSFLVWAATRPKPDQSQIQSIAESNSSQPSPGVFWSEPMIRDLTITDSRSGQVVTVRQLQLVSYQARPGDEIKPATTDDGKPVVWVYRNNRQFVKAELSYRTPDGLVLPVLGYQLIDERTGRLVTFFCPTAGVKIADEPPLGDDT